MRADDSARAKTEWNSYWVNKLTGEEKLAGGPAGDRETLSSANIRNWSRWNVDPYPASEGWTVEYREEPAGTELRRWYRDLRTLHERYPAGSKEAGRPMRAFAYPHVDANGRFVQVEARGKDLKQQVSHPHLPVIRRAIVLADVSSNDLTDPAALAAPWHKSIFCYADLVDMLTDKYSTLRDYDGQLVDLLLPDGRRIEMQPDYQCNPPRAVWGGQGNPVRWEFSDPAAVHDLVGYPEGAWWVCWNTVDLDWGIPGLKGESRVIVWGGLDPRDRYPHRDGPYDSESAATAVYDLFPLEKLGVYWPGTITIWDGHLNTGPIGSSLKTGRVWRMTDVGGSEERANLMDRLYMARLKEAKEFIAEERRKDEEKQKKRSAAAVKAAETRARNRRGF